MSRYSVHTVMVTNLAMLAFAVAQGLAQSDAALKDRVSQLVEKLAAPTAEARNAAAQSLLKLGPQILPLLPDARSIKNDDAKKRLEAVRKDLEAAGQEINLEGSRVTLVGQGIRLSEALQRLQKQTGNPITDLREQMGAEATNPTLDLDIHDKPFLEALDLVAARAGVQLSYYTGDGSIGISAAENMDARPPLNEPTAPTKALVHYTGPFRVELKRCELNRDYATATTAANLQCEIAWEPRLRPMLLALKAGTIAVKDDQGRTVKPRVMEESDEIVVRPENPIAEINLNLDAPERTAKKLASLTFTADISIPAALKTFTFEKVQQTGVTRKQGDVAVTLKGFETEEQVWKVAVEVEYPGGGAPFESYQQGLFNNRIWLLRGDGSRFPQNGGFSNTSSGEGKLAFEYLFVDAPGKPGDYGLVYETPARVLVLPVKVDFRDVELP